VFLACKTTERKRDGVWRELEQSLKYLETDQFDLYQLHAVTKTDDVETIFSDTGALKAFLEAREQGLIRFIGFSAHSVEAAMLLMDGYGFDTILFPTNYATWYAGNFGPQVLQRAHEKGMGILALKAMAGRRLEQGEEKTHPKCWYQPLADPEEALLGLRFTLSHPVTSAIPPGDENLFKMALDLHSRIKPLKEEEVLEIKEKGLAGSPIFRYPST
jgi:predicted aldo/keto reductase-like oxidoreductase